MRPVPDLWTAALPPEAGPRYRRRDPEATTLHRIIRENLESFLASAEEEGRPVPAFVEEEFREYLKCGVLAYSFTRLYCDACRRSRYVAHSCGGRGFCPSCGGRRMSVGAAHLVDLVLPRVPIRQFVLTLPFRLRFIVAFDHDLELEVGAVFIRTVSNWYRLRARRPTRCPRRRIQVSALRVHRIRTCAAREAPWHHRSRASACRVRPVRDSVVGRQGHLG